MNIEIKKYLFDIKESIDSIEKYLGDKRDFNIIRHLPTLKIEINNLLKKV